MPKGKNYGRPGYEKYGANLRDIRIEEMAFKTGHQDPERTARMFGGNSPRVMKNYGQKELVDAYFKAEEHKNNAQELADWHVGKFQAMEKAFGVDFKKLPYYAKTCVQAHTKLHSPFGVYLEGRPKPAEQLVRDQHQMSITNAIALLKKNYYDMFTTVVTNELNIGDKTVSSDDLLAAGFDDDNYQPNPDDFW